MIRYLLLTVVFFSLSACLKTRAELEDENSGQVQERQTQTQAREHTREVRSAPAKEVKEKAPPAAFRFEEYDEQMRSVVGRVDTLENNVSQLNAVKANEQTTAGKDRQANDQKFVAYEEALKKLELQIQSLADEVGRLKAAPTASTTGTVEKSVPSGGKLKSTYDEGEELFNSKKWKEAIVNFQKYRDSNGKGKNYGDATYKIGICFQELGMKEEAKSFFDEVISKFPKSKEAKKAAFRMKTLK